MTIPLFPNMRLQHNDEINNKCIGEVLRNRQVRQVGFDLPSLAIGQQVRLGFMKNSLG